jgi:hypothetical protein
METKIPDVSRALLRETHGPLRVELKLTSCHSLGSVKTVFKKTVNKRRNRLYFGLSYGTLWSGWFCCVLKFFVIFPNLLGDGGVLEILICRGMYKSGMSTDPN